MFVMDDELSIMKGKSMLDIDNIYNGGKTFQSHVQMTYPYVVGSHPPNLTDNNQQKSLLLGLIVR